MTTGDNASPDRSGAIPLCVDLDGTLIRTDSLVESVLKLVSRYPLYILLIPIWILHGKAYLKSRIAQKVIPNPQLLPYNEEVLEFVKDKKQAGRYIVLITASNQKIADAVSKYLGLFDIAVGSNASLNLKGKYKADYLIQTFGVGTFDYIGDSGSDLPVWKSSRNAMVASPSGSVKRLLAKSNIKYISVSEIKGSTPPLTLAKTLRLHQWLKNLLIFIPSITSLSIFDYRLLLNGFIAFLAFGLTASAVYIINDLLDLESDRKHPRKKYRPIASGSVNIIKTTMLAPTLLVISFLLSASTLPALFSSVLLVYLVITSTYSLLLKRIVLLDVITLAGLYTFRVIGGGFAMDIDLTFWLLAFSMFIFLSLAMIKRYTELQETSKSGREHVAGRGYKSTDRHLIQSMGTSSGFLAVLVLAFYINSPAIYVLYSSPIYLWMLCPLLLYWIGRMWMQAERSNIHDDPIVFAVKDRVTYHIVFLSALFIYLAAAGPNIKGAV